MLSSQQINPIRSRPRLEGGAHKTSGANNRSQLKDSAHQIHFRGECLGLKLQRASAHKIHFRGGCLGLKLQKASACKINF